MVNIGIYLYNWYLHDLSNINESLGYCYSQLEIIFIAQPINRGI